MSVGMRQVTVTLLVLLAVAWVYSPLLSAGPIGEDLELLAALGGRGPVALYQVPHVGARPLASLSLFLSRVLWGQADGWPPHAAVWLRLENLLLLGATALAVRSVLRRVAAPWFGEEQARAAGWAAAILLLVHPLSVAMVARAAARGELLAVALGAASVTVFLAARQERRPERLLMAFGLAVLAGLSGRWAVYLPLLLALAEYTSARRHRPAGRRLRTAGTTFVVCAAAVVLEWFGRLAWAPEELHTYLELRAHPVALGLAAEKVGVLLLPVDLYGVGRLGYAFAVTALLLALHPAFVAARRAPRLWGRLLVAWVLSLTLVGVLDADRRVEPGSLFGAELLFGAAIVTTIGLGLGVTAISGARRVVLPSVCVLLYAVLGRGLALPIQEAGRRVDRLRTELVRAAEDRGWTGAYLVLEPPRRVAGVDALADALPVLLSPRLVAGARGVLPREGLWVRGTGLTGLDLWAEEPEFLARRAEGLTVLVPARLFGDPDPATSRVVVDLPPPRPSEGRFGWRGEGRSPGGLSLDPSTQRHVQAAPAPVLSGDLGPDGEPLLEEAELSAPPVVRWHAEEGPAGRDEQFGVWVRSADGPQAVFDLGTSARWMLAPRISSVWFPGVLSHVRDARIRPGAEALPEDVRPRPVGDDWTFDLTRAELPRPVEGEGTWVVTLLDLDDLWTEEHELLEFADGRWRAEGLARRAERRSRGRAGRLLWQLELRAEGVTLVRARGRR